MILSGTTLTLPDSWNNQRSYGTRVLILWPLDVPPCWSVRSHVLVRFLICLLSALQRSVAYTLAAAATREHCKMLTTL
jgi:hypothetical protein